MTMLKSIDTKRNGQVSFETLPVHTIHSIVSGLRLP